MFNRLVGFLFCVGMVSFSIPLQAAKIIKDTSPDPFTFSQQNSTLPKTLITSNSITITGINTATPLTITGGKYSINGASFKSTKTTISNAKAVRVQLLSSSSYNTASSAQLTVGDFTTSFTVITQEDPNLDRTPDQFSFIDLKDVVPGSRQLSNSFTLSGINTLVLAHVEGGRLSVNGSEFSSSDINVKSGDRIQLEILAANNHELTTKATLSIGNVSAGFSVSTRAKQLILPPLSPGNPQFTLAPFLGSSQCSGCHNGIVNNEGTDVSIETDWSSTMMANAARDPYWRAKVRYELNQHADLQSVIGDKCTRCHAPMANFLAKSRQEKVNILDDGVLNANHPLHDAAINGVSCTVCHQIKNSENLGTLSSFSGNYQISTERRIYGPFQQPSVGSMMSAIGYTPVYSEHISSSKLCATCHNLKTPFVDEFGKILSTTEASEFPEQMPYSEWLHSDYAKNPVSGQTCQQCHMSRTNGVKLSSTSPELESRDNFAIHEFVGANRLMLDIFNNNGTALGTLSNNFNETLNKTQEMLNRSASLEKVSSSFNSQGLQFTLKVNSETGHKLPSGYPSRRVILHVIVKDSQGKLVFESGKVNEDGSLVGVDNVVSSAALNFEPHYDEITNSSQVQVYESIMGDNHQKVTHDLLRAVRYLKDNRILPKGFDKTLAPDDIKVVGEALTDDNFRAGSDEITYKINGLTGSQFTIEAELLHQPISYAAAKDLFKLEDPEITDFQLMFEKSKAKTSLITNQSWSILR